MSISLNKKITYWPHTHTIKWNKKKIKQRNKISMHLDGKCNNLTNELNSTILDIRAAGSIE